MKPMKIPALFSLFVVMVLSACGKKDNPIPEATNSSYEFKFLTGPLAGREYKAGGLSPEQAIALFVQEPGTNNKGISLQLLHGDFTFASALALDPSDRVLPFALDGAETGSQAALSLKDGGTQYVFGSVGGNISISNLKRQSAGSNPNGGLATFELRFENATFYDAVAEGENIEVEVKVSGKIIIK
ncbi:hypothetical protein GCM10007415_11720 [Parapedobacter pyrenivorans]|uniref:Lipoprotein n=1 Tax=Parapedobacter pyrenivorans TaxID=1305674 RepID=A0A917M6P7_9SPHI|nr:hypothetical protein [Parapedobacter pyrenivorans]GGG80857.1 hypothetical protein GCM10007415_11720 [Parapedobacter pyrenivorans]